MELYQHQAEAINKMKNGCILCGGVGSGKSITSVTYFMTKVCNGMYDSKADVKIKLPTQTIPLYIITTARKRDTYEWEGEIAHWGLSTNIDISWLNTKVVIDSWNNIEKYVDVTDAFFIFDEQRVVGYGTWAKTFIKIAKRNKWILLSATPGDSWLDYMTVFIANGFYKNKTDFYNRHVVLRWDQRGHYPKIDRYICVEVLMKHRDDLLVDMKFGRLTVPHHLDIFCEYDKEKYKIAEKQKKDPYLLAAGAKKTEAALKDIADVFRVLRKIVASDASRLEQLKEIVERHKKVIVFYNFNYERDILREWLDGSAIEFAEWNGDKHQKIPEGERWVYLVQYAAGAEGWNCVTCNTIVFYSQSYSYKQTLQACGRIDRLNTPYSDLYYYHFKSKSNIDYLISKTLDRKEEFNEKKAAKEIFAKREDDDPFAQFYE